MVDVVDAPAVDPAVAVEQILAEAQVVSADRPPEQVVAYEMAQRQLRQLLDQAEG